MSDIIPAGLQVVDNRKNFYKKEGEKVAVAVLDPVQIKFYNKLNELREAGKPTPMFRCELIHWDENGEIKKTSLSYQTLAPDEVFKIHDIMSTRLSPPKPRRGGRKRQQQAEEGLSTGQSEEGDAEEAPVAAEAAPPSVEPTATEDEPKSAAEKAREVAAEATAKAAEVEKEETAAPPADDGFAELFDDED